MLDAQENVLLNLDDYLTVGQAAKFLGVSASTLRNWDRVRKLSAVRHPVNGDRLYTRIDIQKLLKRLDQQTGD
jgi:excisionase family DNA binding protein